MRRWVCVPMITLCLLLTACGRTGEDEAASLREHYHDMAGCSMEALVTCDQEGLEWEARLKCEYVPGGEITVEVLEPETIAGVRAVLNDTDWSLEFEDASLNVGFLSEEAVSPATCLPRLMSALRDGWLLEENEEKWGETDCLRLTVDTTGAEGGKILWTVWLSRENGVPIHGEIALEEEIIFQLEFTEFSFCDTLTK